MKNGVMPRSVVLACVLLLGTFALLADAPRVGVVTGVVHDADGQPMPGVTPSF